jgi:hypothetical protein
VGSVSQLEDPYGLDEEDEDAPYQTDPGSALQDHCPVDIRQRHGAHHTAEALSLRQKKVESWSQGEWCQKILL